MPDPVHLVRRLFEERYRSTPDLYRAPGRVNLIGEHTDYTLGYVLPIAIDMACYVGSAPNSDHVLRVYSANFDQGREWPIGRLGALRPAKDWSDYVAGVAQLVQPACGADLLIHSEVPIGSGLSSSAALEVSTGLALGGKPEELPRLCQRAEREFVGMPCGIMDQFVSVHGQRGAAILLDCRSLESRPVRLPAGGAIVVVNSMVKHELGSSAYRDRVAECAAAAREIGPLRDATLDAVDRISSDVIRRRARHVVTENARVLAFVAAAEAGDLARMGRLFFESHSSLRDDFEVSCAELDFLVDTAAGLPGVYGARMTGGGFGGCTVNLLRPEAVEQFESAIRQRYREQFAIDPLLYRVEPSAGASKIL